MFSLRSLPVIIAHAVFIVKNLILSQDRKALFLYFHNTDAAVGGHVSSPEPGRIILIKVIHQGPQSTAVAGNQHIALFFAHFADQFLQEIRRPAAYVPYGFPLVGRLVTKGIQKEVLERIRWNLVVILMAGQALPDTETDFLQSPVCDDGDVP